MQVVALAIKWGRHSLKLGLVKSWYGWYVGWNGERMFAQPGEYVFFTPFRGFCLEIRALVFFYRSCMKRGVRRDSSAILCRMGAHATSNDTHSLREMVEEGMLGFIISFY